MKKIILLLIISSATFSFSFADNVDGPSVYLKSAVDTVDGGKLVKVTVSLSEPVIRFASDLVGVDGGRLESVRKLNSYSYLLFIRAADSSRELNVQVEADKVQNTAKVFNNYSSNELIIKVNPVVAPAPTGPSNSEISNLLDTVVRTQQAQTQAIQAQQAQAAQQTQVAPAVTYVNCNGVTIPSTQTCTAPAAYNTVAPSSGYYDLYGNYYPNTNYYNTPTYYPGTVPYNYSSYGNYYNSAPYYYNSTPTYYPSTSYSTGYGIGSWLGW